MDNIRFDELGLNEKILRAVKDMGFEEASPIQAQAIPLQMEGKDIIGQAQTGTGKTAKEASWMVTPRKVSSWFTTSWLSLVSQTSNSEP